MYISNYAVDYRSTAAYVKVTSYGTCIPFKVKIKTVSGAKDMTYGLVEDRISRRLDYIWISLRLHCLAPKEIIDNIFYK